MIADPLHRVELPVYRRRAVLQKLAEFGPEGAGVSDLMEALGYFEEIHGSGRYSVPLREERLRRSIVYADLEWLATNLDVEKLAGARPGRVSWRAISERRR